MTNRKLILASASPRRKELLARLTKHFEIMVCSDEEHSDADVPCFRVMELAEHKAKAVAARIPDSALVIGADTVVAYGDEILGKPKDEADAGRMLTLLQGNTHSVYTGITLVFIDKSGRTGEYCFFEKTDVTMYPMDEDEINRYIATGEPMDKAGSYGIQGRCAIYIKQIEGDYNNVVGLPVARLYQELRRVGYDLKL